MRYHRLFLVAPVLMLNTHLSAVDLNSIQSSISAYIGKTGCISGDLQCELFTSNDKKSGIVCIKNGDKRSKKLYMLIDLSVDKLEPKIIKNGIKTVKDVVVYRGVRYITEKKWSSAVLD